MIADQSHTTDALVIGAGPAGLAAAEVMAQSGYKVMVADAMPSPARKFLMAGKSGLNLTKSEPIGVFLRFYGDGSGVLPAIVADFGPGEVQSWARGLGQEMFTGSSGRVFPSVMKASPLLRAWLARLEGLGLVLQRRWRWIGVDGDTFVFDTPQGATSVTAKAVVLALGGASWARLGSDGRWADVVSRRSIPVVPFAASNAGLQVNWSDHMRAHFGKPLKNVVFRAADILSRGEAVISEKGLEGGGLYPLGPAVRDQAPVFVDLVPDVSQVHLTARIDRPRGKSSLGNHLRKSARLKPEHIALLNEFARPLPQSTEDLAQLIKALPIRHQGLRPMDEAISTVGGVPLSAVDRGLMLRDWPGGVLRR